MATMTEVFVESRPCGLETFDKDWGIGTSGMVEDSSPFSRVNRLLNNCFATEYTVDHQRACLVTEAYQKYQEIGRAHV
jgi:hypothetical protein